MKLTLCFLFAVASLFAQAGPCGSAPHCAVLNWTPGVGGGASTGFNIKRSTTTGGPYTQVGTATANTFTDLSGTGNVLVEGTKYFWVITATGPGGESAPSTEVNGTVPFSSPPTPTLPAVAMH